MNETERSEKFAAALKAAAAKALMIDPSDALALVDTSKLTLEPDGTVKGAEESIATLKTAKPHFFYKHSRDMSEAERTEWWKDYARRFPGGAPRPEPLDMSRTAKQMTARERADFIREVSRRY